MIFKETQARAKKAKETEKNVHQQVCTYIDLQYPTIIYTSDASGMRCSMGLRMELKRKRCKRYKIPDLLILHPNKGYHGLILEIKKDGEKITKRDGEYVDEHIEEQAKTLCRLKEIGFAASFAIGFNEAKRIIDDYLKP